MVAVPTADYVPSRANPFADDLARAHSSYCAWHDGKLVSTLAPECPPAPLAEFVHDSFRALVLNPKFSCIGAKSAISGGAYRFGLYPEMNTPAATAALAHDLWTFVQEQPSFAPEFSTFVATFASPVVSDEHQWEILVWAQLQSLHDLDGEHHAWDAGVSNDPEDREFSFSFANRAYFVVGLHPASSRHARRFAWATLVFNAREQFEWLRQRDQFERMQATIRGRERRLQGSLNPNLSDFGESSEARQYSGRAVEKDWRCPFHARPRGEPESGD